MANCCSTRINIIHEDDDKILELENVIKNCSPHEKTSEFFQGFELYHIITKTGIGTVGENKNTDLRCRGDIVYMENFGSELVIETETAWVPFIKMWVKLLEKYLPDAQLFYAAEEPGCNVWATNDPNYENRYVFDAYGLDDYDYESDWAMSEENLTAVLMELLKTDETDLEKLLELFEDSDYVEQISINKWEYANENEWD